MNIFIRIIAIAATTLVVACGARAQEAWPTKPIRIIVPFGAGSGLDIMARGFAERLGQQTRVPVVVDNKDGAGGTIGTIAAARAPADGYTLLFTANGPFAVAPFMQDGASYDPSADFTALTRVAVIPMVLVTGSSTKYKRFDDMVADARMRPGKLDYASSGVGTPSHLNVEVIKSKLGLDIVAVPYKSTGQAMTDLVGGQTALYMPSFPAALPQIKAGQARALAIGSAQRSRLLPEVPTISEALNQPNLQASVWYGFFAPKGLPFELAQRVHAELAKAAASPQIAALTDKLGAEAVLDGPREFQALVRRDADDARTLLQSLGIQKGR